VPNTDTIPALQRVLRDTCRAGYSGSPVLPLALYR
jgi:hypothetical protein